ncbi:hypothetical protein [Demequina sp. NBRC 110052]|uniref:hypothetical protein n=1 Tax=Demequina sp. NBRC 110052 TaxID=1570341 RepID=UPI000A014ECB|nr:hypothetical protein [Demequina sp. NBRC 110052]
MKHIRLHTCFFECVGHKVNTRQFELAINAGEPRLVQLVGEHSTGFLVAPLYGTDHVEAWCMHEESRAIVRRNIEHGDLVIRGYTYGVASLAKGLISYTSPEFWRECPSHEEMTPLMAGFIHEPDFAAVFGSSAPDQRRRDPGSAPDAQEP